MSTDNIFQPIYLDTPEEVEAFMKAWEESEKDCDFEVPVSAKVLRTPEEVNSFFKRRGSVAKELAREKEHHFGIQVRWIEGLQEYFAKVPAYPDFEVQGKTLKEAVDKAQSGIEAWINEQKAAGKDIVPFPPEETDRECHYNLRITWSDFDQQFIVSVPALAGCMSDGKTLEEAIKNIKEVVYVWLESQRQDVKEGLIRPVDSYSKSEQEYNKTHFGVNIMWDDESRVYLVGIPEFTDCFARGDTLDEAVENAEFAVSLWIPTNASDFAESAAAYLYPAIFQKEGASYNVRFPDFDGCYTCGNDLKDAFCMAEDALAFVIVDKVKANEELPEPSEIEDIKLSSDEEAHYIFTDLHAYLNNTYDEEDNEDD